MLGFPGVCFESKVTTKFGSEDRISPSTYWHTRIHFEGTCHISMVLQIDIKYVCPSGNFRGTRWCLMMPDDAWWWWWWWCLMMPDEDSPFQQRWCLQCLSFGLFRNSPGDSCWCQAEAFVHAAWKHRRYPGGCGLCHRQTTITGDASQLWR